MSWNDRVSDVDVGYQANMASWLTVCVCLCSTGHLSWRCSLEKRFVVENQTGQTNSCFSGLESFVNVGRVGWCKLHGWQRVALLKISYFGADSNKF